MSDDICSGPGWVYDVVGETGSLLFVHKNCPKCGRWIKCGDVFMNAFGDVSLQGFTCSRCGEVKPMYVFIGEDELVQEKMH